MTCGVVIEATLAGGRVYPVIMRAVCFACGPGARGFVRISAGMSSPAKWTMSISESSTCWIKKFTLVMKWRVRLWLPLYRVAIAIIDALSEKRLVGVGCGKPSSSKTFLNQMMSHVAVTAAEVSDSAVDRGLSVEPSIASRT